MRTHEARCPHRQRRGHFFSLPERLLEIRLDANQRNIHTARLRGAVAASRLTNVYGEREAHEQQSPPVAGRDAGRNRGKVDVATRLSPKTRPDASEKSSFR